MANNKTITLNLDVQAKLGDLQSQVGKIQQLLGQLKMPDGLTSKTNESVNQLLEKIKKVQEYTEDNELNLINEKNIQNEFNSIEKEFKSLVTKLNASSSKIHLGDNKAAAALADGIDKYKKGISAATKEFEKQEKVVNDLKKQFQDLENSAKTAKDIADQRRQAFNSASIKKSNLESADEAAYQNYKNTHNPSWSEKQARAYYNNTKVHKDLSTQRVSAEAELLEAKKQLEIAEKAETDAVDKLNATRGKYQVEITKETNALNKLKGTLDSVKSTELQKVKDELSNLASKGVIFNFDPQSIQSVDELKQHLKDIDAADLASIVEILDKIGVAAKDGADGTEALSKGVDKSVQSSKDLSSELEQFKNKVKYFFALDNAVRLFQRALQSAFKTVKDLDAVMTEMAVVTEFSVGDIWERLPEYTKRANELGVSIHDAYESMTIYYQQGLNTNEAVALSNETLKMARIAGLDAAEATDRMTNALRGFNMELNEVSAQRVDDVYNKLAAISASDVNEISIAMTKVASLANNANMEFETTAAFLAQMIETTRESAETAGTALKTVVARFSEVKNLFSKQELTGTDEEGEIIDVNKVGTALRTAGIDLNKYFIGEVGLDDIFLELASKWDSLDSVQQRFIATQAAGSRQQSRFIAMMADYGRTMQLVSAAEASGGAANEMFGKTLESLQTKLNKLKNAWDTFLMGIAENEVIKFAVDALTELITIINNLLDALSGGNGLIKSFETIAGAIMGGKLLKSLFSGIFDNLGVRALEAIRGSANEIKKGEKIYEKSGKELGLALRAGFEKTKFNGKNFFSSIGKSIKASVSGGKARFTPYELGMDPNQLIDLKSLNLNELSPEALENLRKQLEKTYFSQLSVGLNPYESGMLLDEIRNRSLEDLVEDAENYGITLDELDEAGRITAETGEDLGITFENNTKQLNNVGTACSITGGLMLGLASILDKVAGEGNAASGVLKVIGSVLLAMPAIIKVVEVTLSMALKKTSAEIAAMPIVGQITAVISLVTIALGLLATFVKNSSAEAKLEKATDAAAKAKEEADSLKQSYEELNKTLDSLDEKYTAIEKMTQGSQEWRNAVSEINSEVLELLENYGKFGVTAIIGEGGVLQVEGLDEAKEKIEKTMNHSFVLSTFADKDVVKANREALYSDFEYKAENTLDAADGRTVRDQFATEEIAKVVAGDFEALNKYKNVLEGTNGPAEQIEKLSEYFGVYIDTTSDAISALTSFGNQLKETEAQIKNYDTILASEAIQTTGLTGDQAKQAANYLTSDRINKKIDKVDIGEDLVNGLYEAFWQGQYGSGTRVNRRGRVTYKDSDGKTQHISAKEAKAKYANVKGIEAAGADAETFVNNLASMGTEWQNLFTQTGGKGLSYIDLGKIEEQLEAGEISEENKGALQEAMVKILGDGDYTVEINGLIATKEAQARLEGDLRKLGIEVELKDIDIPSGAIENIKEKIISSDMSQEVARAYWDAFSAAVGSADKSNQDAVANYLSTIDPSDFTSLLQAREQLSDWGVGTKYINDFWNAAVEGGNAYIKSASEALKIQGLINTSFQEAKTIEDNLVDGKATVEQMIKLVEAGADISNFQFTGEGYKASAEQAKEMAGLLTDGLLTDTDIILNSLRAKIEQATKISGYDFLEINKISGVEDINDKNVGMIGANLKYAGILTGEEASLSNYGSTEEYIAAIREAYEIYKGLIGEEGTQIEGILEKQEAYMAASKYTADENALRTKGTDKEGIRYSMQNEAKELGLDSDEVTNYADALYNVLNAESETEKVSQQMADRLALDAAKISSGAKEITDDYDDWSDVLKNIDENSIEFTSTLNKLASATAKMLNADEEIVKTLMLETEYRELAKKAAEGDAQAYNDLQKKTTKANFNEDQLNQEINGLGTLEDVINAVADTDLEFGEVVEDDTLANQLTSIYDEAVKAALAGGASVAEAQKAGIKAINESGFDLDPEQMEAEEVTVTGSLPPDVDVQAEPQTIDGVTYSDIKHVPGDSSKFQYTTTILKPKNGSAFKKSSENVGDGRSKKTGGGGSKKNKSKAWKNPYDELYNKVEELNENLRDREYIQREYNRLLEDQNTTAQELINKSLEEIKNLRQQEDIQKQLLAGRRRQMRDLKYEYYVDDKGNRTTYEALDLIKYGYYDEAKQQIVIDWEAIEEVTDEERGKQIEEYIGRLEEIAGQIEDTEDALDQIQDEIYELEERNKDTYLELEQRVYDALVEQEQKTIDQFQELSDTISESNERILSDLQDSIDLQRQIRDNTETENDIADKEQRLAYLQRDTSGANASEILKLQKELEEARQDYQDNLIDQKIEELEKDNEEAAEQRERQIALLQEQLDWNAENGAFWKEVHDLIANSFDENGAMNVNSPLVALLEETDIFRGMSEFGKMDWIDKMAEQWLMGQEGKSNWEMDKAREQNNPIKVTTDSGEEKSLTFDENGKEWVDSEGNSYVVGYNAQTGQYETTLKETAEEKEQRRKTEGMVSGIAQDLGYMSSLKKLSDTEKEQRIKDVTALQTALTNLGFYTGKIDGKFTKGKKDTYVDYALKAFQKSMGVPETGILDDQTRAAFSWRHYKTGGIADFTGPAWLDGTKSKPELVLNATDTKNFIALREVLAQFLKGSYTSSTNSGDNYFDISISADIASDYDVDRLAERIKRQITEDATYRNVNAISWMR